VSSFHVCFSLSAPAATLCSRSCFYYQVTLVRDGLRVVSGDFSRYLAGLPQSKTISYLHLQFFLCCFGYNLSTVWYIGTDTGALVKDYAISGAVTNVSLWPSRAGSSDFVTQVSLFLSQNNQLDPGTTLFASFFGINDFGASGVDGPTNLPAAAQTILDQITLLTQPPTNARSWLVVDDYGVGAESAAGDAFKQKYFSGLQDIVASVEGFHVAFVDLKTLWSGVLGPTPGFGAFGYTSSGACLVSGSTTVGGCSDPAHSFYWLPGHPSNETHRIMADYIEEVLVQCV